MKEMYRIGLAKHLNKNRYKVAITTPDPAMAKNNHQTVPRSPKYLARFPPPTFCIKRFFMSEFSGKQNLVKSITVR